MIRSEDTASPSLRLVSEPAPRGPHRDRGPGSWARARASGAMVRQPMARRRVWGTGGRTGRGAPPERPRGVPQRGRVILDPPHAPDS